jgi:hypothetical protein
MLQKGVCRRFRIGALLSAIDVLDGSPPKAKSDVICSAPDGGEGHCQRKCT